MGRITVPCFLKRKAEGERLAMLTAYDYPTAMLMDASGIDAILVGDSCAMTVMGRDNTLSITVDELLHHVKMVTAATEHAMVVADMPFLSYHTGPDDAVRNAGRFIAEGGAQAVKVEGAHPKVLEAIAAILAAGIPVMGHEGLTPQSVLHYGGFRVQGREVEAGTRIREDARALQEVGCFAVVLECIPPDLASQVTAALDVPTIGIGAGSGCDGQILVMHDILGWGKTRFSKTYADVRKLMGEAFSEYVSEVKDGTFPAEEHDYS